jgi:hypothetical protein
MSKIVDLADVKLKRQNEALYEHIKFFEEAVKMNENLIAENIKRLIGQYEPEYIVDTYASQIISSSISHKSKEEILEMITFGGIFSAQRLLFDELMDNQVIIAAIKENQSKILGGK